MALLDFLKRKTENEKAKEKSAAKAPQKTVEKKAEKASVSQKAVKTPAVPSAGGKFSYEVVKEPHISEKATILSEKNSYVFKVYSRANKPQIKKAVEGIYGVNVLNVNIIKIPPKKRRLGRTEGFKKGYAKAVVKIKEGQKIEIF